MFRVLTLVAMLLVSPTLFAKGQTNYISEDIYVFVHGGPGNQFRIIGSVEAGQPVQLLGKTQGDYSQIIDHKGREGWVLTSQLQASPSFRVVEPDLRSKLKASQDKLQQAMTSGQSQKSQITSANEQISQLKAALETASQERDTAKAELANMVDDQNYDMWRQGGMIAGFGLILGLIVAYLPRPQRRNKNRWM